MAFRLKRTETVEEGIKRILLEQMGKAENELSDTDADVHEAVHQARKRCKKVRAVYRLVRPEIPDVYSRENVRFRDAAKELSTVRDAEAMIETYDRLMERFEDVAERRDYANIRRRLTMRRNSVAENESDLDAKVERFLRELKKARSEVGSWSLSSGGFEAIQTGIEKTYKRGRKAMQTALDKPTNANFHEWRKSAKYHRFHVRTLRNLWPGVFVPLEKEISQLAEYLGDDHDLAVLTELLHEHREDYGRHARLEGFLGLIEIQRQELKNEARLLGERIYACKPKALCRQFREFWNAWRKSPEPLVV